MTRLPVGEPFTVWNFAKRIDAPRRRREIHLGCFGLFKKIENLIVVCASDRTDGHRCRHHLNGIVGKESLWESARGGL
jgi:hypothetical protein